MDPLKQFALSANQLGLTLGKRKSADGKKLKEAYDEFIRLSEGIRQLIRSNTFPALEGCLWVTLILTGQLVGTIVIVINELRRRGLNTSEKIITDKYDCLDKAVLAFGASVKAIVLYKEYDI